MNPIIESKLIECLGALEAGQSIDEILARHPEQAAELRPLLETAVRLTQLPLQPSVAARDASLRAFLAEAAVVRERPPVRVGVAASVAFLRRLVLPLATVALVGILFFGGLLLASGTSLPGDTLYGLKLSLEQQRLELLGDSPARAELRAQFEVARYNEVLALLESGRSVRVDDFGGDMETWNSERWQVSRPGRPWIDLYFDENSQIVGEPAQGAYIHISGWTANGRFIVDIVVVGSHPAQHQAPAIESTPVATPEPEPVASPELPIREGSYTDDSTPAITATPSATLTATPTRAGTGLPGDDDDPDDDDDDHDDDHDPDDDDDPDDDGNHG